MLKSITVKAVACALFALAVAYAHTARAGQEVSGDVFASGVSFENYATGAFDPTLSDEGQSGGPYHWRASETDEVAVVTSYESIGYNTYDYGAHNLKRSSYLKGIEPDQQTFLALSVDQDVHRSIFERLDYDGSFSNVLVRSGTRESIYCDLLVQFTLGDSEPTLDEDVRIAVWARAIEEDDGTVSTNLMVTAGCFTNSFTKAIPRSYRLDLSAHREKYPAKTLDSSVWYRLTVRAHGDVSPQGAGLAGFTVYLDGVPLPALADDYEICEPAGLRQDWLVPEARALLAERRLFPGLVTPGSDKAFTVSGFTFSGDGSVDDISFSSEDPGFAEPETVFTLAWDGGVTSLKYTLDGGATVCDAPVSTKRSLDILLGAAATNGCTLKVVECLYASEDGFKPGVWLGSNGATATNVSQTATSGAGSFVFDGTTENPIASVASTRETIDVGPGSPYDTFASALAALKASTNEVKVLRLTTNLVVKTMLKKDRDAYGNRDSGYVDFSDGDGDYVLDLNGSTLRGSGREPTLSVRCKSLRIVDSGPVDPATLRKTGRILPVDDYLNPTDRLNTAVQVYPQASGAAVEPVLTIQEGWYDGWVRKPVNGGLVGAIFVEGGRFISTNAATFYLDAGVTNATLQFVYREGYWASCGETDVMVWTGLGDGRRWADPANWKALRVPAAGETAIFPSRAEGADPWTVDFEANGMTTTNLWLEGDVRLSGTNEFQNVRLAGDGCGRVCGDAQLVFDGDQPGRLTETLLRDDWAGEVLVKNVGYPKTKAAKILKSPETWGTPGSTVVFNGVRGYVMDLLTHTMEYDLVLRDDIRTDESTGAVVTNLAWQNDSGYTGSTLAFKGALCGNGTLRCGANTRAILQLIKFADVTNFTGRLEIDGKRVLIGSDREVAALPGLIAFGHVAAVNSNCGWQSRYALFGETLYVTGRTNDVLVTCTQADPDLSVCENVILNNATEPKVALTSSGTKPYRISITWVPTANAVAAQANVPRVASAAFATTALSAVSGDSYSAAALRAAAYSVAATAVESADVSLEVGEDAVFVIVGNASSGLWYGVRHRASLAEEWTAPSRWLQATDSTVTLSCDKSGDAGFYGVMVAIEDPTKGGSEP